MIITKNNKTNVYYVTFAYEYKDSQVQNITSLSVALYNIVNELPVELTDGQFVVNLQRYLENHFNDRCYISIINYWFLKE